MTLSDRIAVMNAGVVEQVGTAQEIYEYPKTPFVAQFIGSINTLEGDVREASAESIAVMGSGRSPIIVRPSRDGNRVLPRVTAGKPVKILIRPEKLKVLRSAPGPDQNWIEGTLKEMLYQGPMTQLFIQPKDSHLPTLIATQANSALVARKSFNQGDKVYLAWFPEDCLVLASENALG